MDSVQNLPIAEVVLYAYAADRTPYPTYVCLPSGLYKARNGQIVAQTGPDQESYLCQACTSSMDGGYTQRYQSPVTYHAPKSRQSEISLTPAPSASTEPTRSPEEEARDILATAAKNQAEDGPNTRRAAIRACKYLRAMVNQYGSTIQEVHKAARIHTQMSKAQQGQPRNIVHKEESSQ